MVAEEGDGLDGGAEDLVAVGEEAARGSDPSRSAAKKRWSAMRRRR